MVLNTAIHLKLKFAILYHNQTVLDQIRIQCAIFYKIMLKNFSTKNFSTLFKIQRTEFPHKNRRRKRSPPALILQIKLSLQCSITHCRKHLCQSSIGDDSCVINSSVICSNARSDSHTSFSTSTDRCFNIQCVVIV